ncbi:hypothetical protein BgiBS90_030603 [Biomphalaria glabrata]|nr:hypothetical protein BgiBS90_030603 [Biomphalaria glabrata]
MNEEIETRAFKAKLQICLAYSCTTYQQMFDGLSGSSLNTMKMATLSLTSKLSVANYQFVILSKQLIFLGNLLSDDYIFLFGIFLN